MKKEDLFGKTGRPKSMSLRVVCNLCLPDSWNRKRRREEYTIKMVMEDKTLDRIRTEEGGEGRETEIFNKDSLSFPFLSSS